MNFKEIFEQNEVIDLIEKQLNQDEYYNIVQWDSILKFKTKIELENYLVSLDKTFVYTDLSKLAIHLIKKHFIIEIKISCN